MAKDKEWERIFGFPRRDSDTTFEQHHADLGLAIRLVTEEIIVKMAKHVKEITNVDYLCMAEGVALNCVANGKLQKENIFKDIFIQPAAGDAGGALGAALAAHYIHFGKERVVDEDDSMKDAYL